MWEGSKGDIAIDELSLNLNADQCGKILLTLLTRVFVTCETERKVTFL